MQQHNNNNKILYNNNNLLLKQQWMNESYNKFQQVVSHQHIKRTTFVT